MFSVRTLTVVASRQVVSVAAAPDHTVVLLQASCPSLPHDASFVDVAASNGAHEDGNRSLADEEEGDADSDIDDANDEGDHFAGDDGLSCVVASAAASGCEPLTLKQCCEVKLAKEVDLHNAGAMLAYAVRRVCLFLVSFSRHTNSFGRYIS